MKKPIVLSIVSDTHCGSTVALCPPKITLDDGGEYHGSKAQRWLWQCWGEYWDRVKAARRLAKADLYAVFNGDLVDGNHHGTTQILSGNGNVQGQVWTECVKPVIALKPDKWFFVRGTEAHVGPSASSEEKIADGLRRDKRGVEGDPERGTASWWHLKLDLHGVRLDFAHHGRVGTRPWTKPNVTAGLAAEVFYDYASHGIPHPHLAIRSHMHQWVDTFDQHPVRVIQTPAWQLATSFIHRIAPGKLADVGGVIVTIEPDGSYEVEKVKFTPEPAKAWSPT